jgi:hypothetical protein
MLDWAARIDDLADRLVREYAVDDREAAAILLSALVFCPRTPSVWLILETNWYARDCQAAWFSFGELWTPVSLARLRARSPWREVEAETKEWLDSPSGERLFVEPDFDRYPRWNRLTQAQYLLQRALRIRAKSARAADPLRTLDKYNEDRRADELNAAARYVLEDRAQARPAGPPRFVQPADYLYHVELIQRLAPWYPDWHQLVKAFGLVAVRHAYLHGREETGPEDNQAMARAARDSVPLWIAKALGLLLKGPAGIPVLEKAMALEEKRVRSGHGARMELARLRRNGLIEWRPQKLHWTIAGERRQGILDVLEGCAFGAGRSASAAD